MKNVVGNCVRLCVISQRRDAAAALGARRARVSRRWEKGFRTCLPLPDYVLGHQLHDLYTDGPAAARPAGLLGSGKWKVRNPIFFSNGQILRRAV